MEIAFQDVYKKEKTLNKLNYANIIPIIVEKGRCKNGERFKDKK